MISTDKKIEICSELGQLLTSNLENGEMDDLLERIQSVNPWFTIPSVRKSIAAIVENYLDKDNLHDWVENYSMQNLNRPKKVGLVMAGNIPAVGFHDLLSVFISNNISQIKLSSKDDILLPYMIKQLIEIAPETKEYFETVDKLTGYDAVIATGGNNTSKYFEYYFKDVPHIIRKSRSSVAILTGDESDEDLVALGDDIFTYFGMGCRNVSKLYIPENYNIGNLLEVLHRFNDIILHNKYKNNFDFNIALFLLNKLTFFNNGCIVLKEDSQISSRIACVNYQYYDNMGNIVNEILDQKDEIQCLVSLEDIDGIETFRFGEAQYPKLDDYADGVDTLTFLLNL